MIRQRRTARTGDAVVELLVDRVSASVAGRRCPTGPLAGATVASVVLVGSVEADPGRLLVAVLLEGLPSNEEHVNEADPDGWLGAIGTEVRGLLARAGWPDAPVVFDAADRVAAAGGPWRYYRN